MNIFRTNLAVRTLGSLALTMSCEATSAVEMERMNRYSLHSLAAESSQVDLLSAVIETRFPPYVETVGTAIDYILYRSGFRHVATADIQQTLAMPLPETHRSIGPLDVRTAVKTIVGQPWELHEDVGQRILWFQRAGADSIEVIESPAAASNSQVRTNAADPANDSALTSPGTWQLQSSMTLRENLESWTQLADWSLEWRTRHDYAITQSSAFSGTLVDAVSSLLAHYRNAPVPLIGKFYSGNSVLVIEPDAYTSSSSR